MIWQEKWKTIKSHPLFQPGVLILLAVLLTVLLQLKFSTDLPIATSTPKPTSADTFIPAGHVLVPIEIQNLRALDSIIGKSGVVDLFLPTSELRKKPLSIKRRAKILRAPNNPMQFAVLVREEEAGSLLWANEPLFAVVQNPLHDSPVKIVEQKMKQSRIIFRNLQKEH